MLRRRHTILMFGIATSVLVVVTVKLFLSTPQMGPQDTTEEAAIETAIHEELSQMVANVAEANQTQVLVDSQFRNLTDQTVDSISDIAMSRLRNPIHPGRASTQKRLRQETAEETFLHLSDVDGVVMAMCSPQLGSIGFAAGSYDSDTEIMTTLVPVRKLLEDAREHPEKLVPFLEQQLVDISRLHQKKCEEYSRLYGDANGMVILPGLPEDTQDALRSTAAVYVLSEIGACQSLPVIAWLSELPSPLTTLNAKYTRTVSKKFLFYAMHTLVTRLPVESLPEQVVQARYEYLKLAETARIPEAIQMRVTSWDAYYHEQDFRRTMLQKKLNLKAESTIEMSHYPELHMEEQDMEPLLAALRKFTQLAFPDAKDL